KTPKAPTRAPHLKLLVVPSTFARVNHRIIAQASYLFNQTPINLLSCRYITQNQQKTSGIHSNNSALLCPSNIILLHSPLRDGLPTANTHATHTARSGPSCHGRQVAAESLRLLACESCVISTFIPCLLVGQTADRLRDPTMQTAEALNTECLIYGGLLFFTGFHWVYLMLKRTEIREHFGIPGSTVEDCCTTYWCHCCAAIQQDGEVRKRIPISGPIQQGCHTNKAGMLMPRQTGHSNMP
ncbi:PLAC8 family-domain-containing protein, partial [Pseudomassariella vexata]